MRELSPGIFRARFQVGPDVFFYGAAIEDVEHQARALEGPRGERGELLSLELLRDGRWERCRLAPVLRFAR